MNVTLLLNFLELEYDGIFLNAEGLPLLYILLEVACEQCPRNMGCRASCFIAKLEAFSLETHFASLPSVLVLLREKEDLEKFGHSECR